MSPKHPHQGRPPYFHVILFFLDSSVDCKVPRVNQNWSSCSFYLLIWLLIPLLLVKYLKSSLAPLLLPQAKHFGSSLVSHRLQATFPSRSFSYEWPTIISILFRWERTHQSGFSTLEKISYVYGNDSDDTDSVQKGFHLSYLSNFPVHPSYQQKGGGKGQKQRRNMFYLLAPYVSQSELDWRWGSEKLPLIVLKLPVARYNTKISS